MKMSPVVHFEMGFKDKKRMADFYKTTFGWKIMELGPQYGDYAIAETAETDKKTGRPTVPGAINGGFYNKNQSGAAPAPSVVIAVDDINASMKAVEKSGGKILGVLDQSGKLTKKPQMIPGVGLWMAIEDTEGNRVSLLQPSGM